MDWFSRWPKDALIAVSNHFLKNFDVVSSKETKQELVNSMGVVHDNVATICVEYFQRFVYLTYNLVNKSRCMFVRFRLFQCS